jgi:hypothetical protein
MEMLTNFFAIRPVYTLYGLRVLWGAYLLDQAIPFVALLSNPNLSFAAIGPLLVLFLHSCLNIAMVRLLIEVAAVVLLKRS